jgi:hypothetical protein
MIFVLILVGVVPVVVAYHWFLLGRGAVLGEFRPSIHDRVEEILRPHEGARVSDAALVELQQRVDSAVRDVLIDLHHRDDELIVLVKNDEILGPVCFIKRRDGDEMSLADYERSLRGQA